MQMKVFLSIYKFIIILMLLNFESCTRAQGEYVFKALFDYEDVWKDRQVTGIYLMDDSTGILLCEDHRNVESIYRDVETFVLRSEDNGKTFVYSSFGKARSLSKLSMSADKSLLCIIQSKASDEKDGLWVSKDAGRSWEKSKVKPLMKKTDCGCQKMLVGHGKKCFPRKRVWMKLCFITIKSVTCRRMTENKNRKNCTRHQTEEGHGYLFNKWRWTIGLFAPLPDPVSCGGYMGRKVFGRWMYEQTR